MRKHNRFFTGFATLAACFVLAVAAASLMQAFAAQEGALEQLKTPLPAPEVTYFDTEGKPQSLAALKGKVVILHFWATWCAPCVTELPIMHKVVAGLKDEKLAVLPLSLDQNPGTVELFMARNNLSLPVAMDRKGDVLRAFQLKGLPSTVILDKNGEIIAVRSGVLNWESIFTRSVIVAALQDKPQPAAPKE